MLPGTTVSSASSAAPRADGVGNGEASKDLFINHLWSRQAGCEKRFRSIKFLPLMRCQNIPHRPLPGWGAPGGWGFPAPPAQERVQFPAYSHSSGRRGSHGETKRQRARRGSRVALPRGSRAPAEQGKLAQPTAFTSLRKWGPAEPLRFPEGWVQPRGLAAYGPRLGSSSRL